MKKVIYLIMFFLSFNLNSIQADFSTTGTPLINHYGLPYLNQMLSIEHDKKSLIDIMPRSLVEAIIKQIEPTITSTDIKVLKDSLLKNDTINLNFYQIIWGPEEAWPDRKFNLIYHNILVKWIENSPGFSALKTQDYNLSANVLMGVFDPNGIVQSLTTSIDPSSITFNKFEPRLVNYHDQAYSPNNAFFFLAPSRNIATFWSAAISPNKEDVLAIAGIEKTKIVVPIKKNIIIIFNTLINDLEIVYNINELIAKKNLQLVLSGLNTITKKLEKTNKEDAQALLQTVEVFKESKKQLKTYDPNLNSLFNKKFLDEILKTNSKIFIDLIDSNPSEHIYQISVLSQEDPTMECKIFPIIGNTCGRHAFKNAIFSNLLFQAYNLNDTRKFVDYAKSLTSLDGSLFIQNIDQLTKEATCIFESINKFLRDYRVSLKLTEQQTVDTEEANLLIHQIPKFTAGCSLPALNINLFTVIGNLNSVIYDTEALTIAQFLEILKQIALSRNEKNYIHSFIIGAGHPERPGEHWINITVNKKPSGVNDYLMMDSQNKPQNSYAQSLKKILEVLDFNNLFADLITQFNKLFSLLKSQVELFKAGKINRDISMEMASPSQKIKSIKNFVKDLADFLIDATNIHDFLNDPLIKKLIPKTEFDIKDINNFVINIFANSGSIKLFSEVTNLKSIAEYFEKFIKDKNIEDFKSSIDKTNIQLNWQKIVGIENVEKLFKEISVITGEAIKTANKSEITKKISEALNNVNKVFLENKASIDVSDPTLGARLEVLKKDISQLPVFASLKATYDKVVSKITNKNQTALSFIQWIQEGIDSTVDTIAKQPLLNYAIASNMPREALELIKWGAKNTRKELGATNTRKPAWFLGVNDLTLAGAPGSRNSIIADPTKGITEKDAAEYRLQIARELGIDPDKLIK